LIDPPEMALVEAKKGSQISKKRKARRLHPSKTKANVPRTNKRTAYPCEAWKPGNQRMALVQGSRQWGRREGRDINKIKR